MYVAVGSVIAGQALLFGSLPLLAYLAIVLVAFAAFVHLYEQPKLTATYGRGCRGVPSCRAGLAAEAAALDPGAVTQV